MPKKQISMMVDRDLVKRLDALIPYVIINKELVAMVGNVTRSTVIRLALLEGIKLLEQKHERNCGEYYR
jgi:hypothetical protein